MITSNPDLPICQWCSHCRKLCKTASNRYDIDCDSNPNLGAVSASLCRCGHYDGKKIQIE